MLEYYYAKFMTHFNPRINEWYLKPFSTAVSSKFARKPLPFFMKYLLETDNNIYDYYIILNIT